MTKIEKVDHLTIYADYDHDIFGDHTIVRAMDGDKTVYFDSWDGIYTFKNGLRGIINRVLECFDYFTRERIGHFCPVIHSENGGDLLSGCVVCDEVTYFKRIDGTQYYKHCAHPVM